MESLSDTLWDVIICGTSLQQSLLALSLSRSDKKILHLDPHEYYGGTEAAFSLQEVDEWATQLAENDSTTQAIFSNASIARPEVAGSSLSFPRAYSIALAPQVIHTRSTLLSQLVSSRAYRQVEFLAVGSFFVLESTQSKSTLARIPSTREAVFSTTAISARAKRQLMKFLKFVLDFENEAQRSTWEPVRDEPLVDFLESQFGLDAQLRTYALALTVSLDGKITVGDGLAMILRHLTSMGMFGPGFAAVYPKWGGTSEIAQVACRAGAVGGATYMLGHGIKAATPRDDHVEVELQGPNGVTVKTKALIRGSDVVAADTRRISRLVAVIQSPLSALFEPLVEGAPTAAVAVIAIPPGAVQLDDGTSLQNYVYVMAHSSDSGECPAGQSLLYFTTVQTPDSKHLLERSLDLLLPALASAGQDAAPACLYQLYYEQATGDASSTSNTNGRVFDFPLAQADLAFNDSALDAVREAWKLVMGSAVDDNPDVEYMKFQDREGMGDDDRDFD